MSTPKIFFSVCYNFSKNAAPLGRTGAVTAQQQMSLTFRLRHKEQFGGHNCDEINSSLTINIFMLSNVRKVENVNMILDAVQRNVTDKE